MPHKPVSWEHLSFAYMMPIQEALKEFAKKNNLEPPILWHQDDTTCFVFRNEKPFERIIQTSIYEDENGIFICIIPQLHKDDRERGKRRMCESIPVSLMRRAPLPAFPLTPDSIEKFASQLMNELSAAWENTYFITPNMLKMEIKLYIAK